MIALKWHDDLSVDAGGRIDREHQELFAILDEIGSMERRRDEGTVRRAVHDLLHCTTEHFADEERMMDRIGWPDRRQHIAEHERLLSVALAWEDRLECGWRPWHGASLHTAISYWFVRHVALDDRRLGAFLDTGVFVPMFPAPTAQSAGLFTSLNA